MAMILTECSDQQWHLIKTSAVGMLQQQQLGMILIKTIQ